MEELENLRDELIGLEIRRDNFFDKDDGVPHYGDQGYQDIVNRINDVEEYIEELTKDEDK